MKVVVLLAGMGRRIRETNIAAHKSLIPINGKSLIYYWMDNIKKSGIDTIIPVLGYNGSYVLDEINRYSHGIKVCPAWNDRYESTNNMVSLLCAKDYVDDNEDVIQFNGDMVFDYRILKEITESEGSCIATDNNEYDCIIDSPKVLVENGAITDIGRHIEQSESCGYALGIYRYSAKLWEDYCELSVKLSRENPNMGFHDPLRFLFKNNDVKPSYTPSTLWMDVDDNADILKAEKMVEKLGY